MRAFDRWTAFLAIDVRDDGAGTSTDANAPGIQPEVDSFAAEDLLNLVVKPMTVKEAMNAADLKSQKEVLRHARRAGLEVLNVKHGAHRRFILFPRGGK